MPDNSNDMIYAGEEVINTGEEAIKPEETIETVEDAEVIQPGESTQNDTFAEAGETVETVEDAAFETVDKTPGSGQMYDTEDADDNNILGILSMISGIVAILFGCCGFCCCNGWLGIIMSTTGVVLGIISLARGENAKGMAIAGIICGSIGLLLAVLIAVKEPFTFVFNKIEETPVEEYFERFKETL